MPIRPVSPPPVYPTGEAPLRTSRLEPRRRFASYVPAPLAPKRVQSIDGLRALGLSLVFLSHASIAAAFPAALVPIAQDPHLGLAGHGVKFFFIISGFLITSILLRELDRTGTIDRMALLRRRAQRILPTLLAFLLVAALLRWAGVYAFEPWRLLAALTFSGRLGCWELGHLWSMAVQEQFNILWALILVVGGRRLASNCAVAAVIIVPLARVVHATLYPDAPSLYLTNGASIDTLALGCLLALHRERLSARRWFNAAVESRYTIPLLYALAGASVLIGWRPSILLRTPLVAAAIVLLLERCIRHPQRGWARILTTRSALYVGSASYSLYLWQQLFLNPYSTSTFAAFPVNVIAALTVGLLSWHLIERPLSARAPHWATRLGEMRAACASWLTSARGAPALRVRSHHTLSPVHAMVASASAIGAAWPLTAFGSRAAAFSLVPYPSALRSEPR
jgi:peptidoglycan/LPS O-acetylase OafA/YrhL